MIGKIRNFDKKKYEILSTSRIKYMMMKKRCR